MQQVKIIERTSGQLLFACSLEEREKAYKFAGQMEQMGIDFEIVSQSLSESLARSLGHDEQAINHLKTIMEDEIDSHNDCCSDHF